MADFAASIDDEELQFRTIAALERSKPFLNLMQLVDNAGDYREDEFAFKEMRYTQSAQQRFDLNRITFDGFSTC